MSDELHYHNAYTLCQLPSESWTRVLVLDPGEFADPITCTLQLYNTDQYDSGGEPIFPTIQLVLSSDLFDV